MLIKNTLRLAKLIEINLLESDKLKLKQLVKKEQYGNNIGLTKRRIMGKFYGKRWKE